MMIVSLAPGKRLPCPTLRYSSSQDSSVSFNGSEINSMLRGLLAEPCEAESAKSISLSKRI